MTQDLSKYRELRNENLWTPQIVYDVPPPNELVRDSYDYGEGTDNVNQEEANNSLLAGATDFFSKLLGGIGAILGGAVEFVGGLLNAVVSGVANLVKGIANGIKGIFGGTTTEWEEDPNHVFSPITESLEEAVLPILEKAEEGITKAGEANQRIVDLGVEFDAKVGEQGVITQRIEGINAEMALQFAEDGLLQQKFDAVRSDLSLATSDLSDDLDLLAQTTGEDYEALNTQLWGDQGELNRINNELWGTQSTLNTTLSDFREMQLEWNSNTTGWIKKQEEIQALNDKFREEQTRVNEEFESLFTILKDAQKKQIETSFRTLTPYMNGGEDEYVKLLPAGGVQAKGSWVGHIIYTTELRKVSGSTSTESSPDRHSHDVTDWYGATYSDTVPSQEGLRTYGGVIKMSAVQYLPTPGTQQVENISRAAFTPGTSWTKVLGFTVDSPGDHIVNAEIHWDAANRGSYYGVEIGVMSAGGGWRRIKVWESNGFGPTFPWESGYRVSKIIDSFDISEAEATGQAEIQLRAYSSGSAAQRYTRSSSLEITYIKQPTT
jgi:hypothetical protein